MASRLHVLVAPLALALLAAGCAKTVLPMGVPMPTLRTELNAAEKRTVDDADLAGDPGRATLSASRLKQEATATRGATLVFATQANGASRTRVSRGTGPVIAGSLSYPDFKGALIPAVNVTVHVESNGKDVATALTDAKGQWQVELPAATSGKAVTTSYELGNTYWTLNKYRWAGPAVDALAPTNDTGARTLDANSQNGQAALIHQVWNRALGEFQKDGIALDWWNRRIGTNWPVTGNYYSMGTVNLSNAEWWDVNGHEIGHAMFFAAFNSAGGGGQHKIDECYGADLAWSEGYASFFSSVISIARDDADAKFEYMVPRRAPIRVENVPDDVCGGHTNEWRVGSAMWDLYDSHEDGTDKVAVDFKTLWAPLVKTQNNARMSDVRDAFKRIAAQAEAGQRPGLQQAFGQSGVPVTFSLQAGF